MSKFRIKKYHKGNGDVYYRVDVKLGYIIGWYGLDKYGQAKGGTYMDTIDEVYAAIEQYNAEKVVRVETEIISRK